MLVLARKQNETIVITTPAGDVIEIVVVELRGDKVRLGVHAPVTIRVDRKEIHDIRKQEQASGQEA